MTMYPDLGPVEVGDVLRFESSGDWEVHYVTVSKLTKKLIVIDKVTDFEGRPSKFSRKHGALSPNPGGRLLPYHRDPTSS